MELQIFDHGFEAGEDLSEYQYYGVVLDTDNKIYLADGHAGIPLGILQNKPKIGEAGTVRIEGISVAVSSGAVTAMVPQKFSGGKVTDVTESGDRYNCIALDTSDDDGEEISVLMERGYYVAA